MKRAAPTLLLLLTSCTFFGFAFARRQPAFIPIGAVFIALGLATAKRKG